MKASLHWKEYGAELLGTAIMVFFGLSAVVFDFAPGLPMEHWLPDASLRRLLTGFLFAGVGSLVAISPLGRLSGAHVNPAVSLAFWMQGKMHPHDLGGFIVSQFLGGILGAFLLVAVWGSHAAGIHNGMTMPSLDYPLWVPVVLEILLTATLILSIFIFVSFPRLMRWTPLMTWFLVAAMVWLEAPVSGMSINPARSFGPALVSGIWMGQWIYFVSPITGAILAVWIFRGLRQLYRQPHNLLTRKLFETGEVFKQTLPPALRGRLRRVFAR